jgi:hypothetical protein
MVALRTLGLVIMATFVISIGFLGYVSFGALMRDKAARDAMLKVGHTCDDAIDIPGTHVVENIEVPAGYEMKLTDNRIEIDGHRYPEAGFPVKFRNTMKLGPGTYRLLIELSENELVVTRI